MRFEEGVKVEEKSYEGGRGDNDDEEDNQDHVNVNVDK